MHEVIANLSRNTILRKSSLVLFGSVIYDPKGSCGPRVQQDYQLVAIHSGEVHISIDDEEMELTAGCVALLRPGHRENFLFSRTTQTHHTWCSIAPARVSSELGLRIARAPLQLPITSRIQALIDLGLATPDLGLPEMLESINKLGDALLQEYLATAALGEDKRGRTPQAIRRAKAMIELELSSELSLNRLAAGAFCSPNHLTRLFREHTKTTPMRYVWQRRVDRGLEMLRQTGLTISEISDRTGFQSPFHFSRLIRERSGHSPSELRRLSWKAG